MRTQLMLLTAIMLCGCESMTSRFSPQRQYLLSIHEYTATPRLGSFERPVEFRPGHVVYVRQIPLINHTSINRVEVVPLGDHFGLRCYLSAHGRLLWMQAASEFHGRRVALLLDGLFRGFFVVGRPDETSIMIPLSMTEEEARRIADRADDNYANSRGN